MIQRRNLPERNEQNNFGARPPQRHTFIAKYIFTGFCLSALVACGGPQRLPENVSLDASKSLVEERLIAPLSIDTGSAAVLPTRKPRRQLLQIRYHHDSLYNPDFISSLYRLTAIHGLKNSGDEPLSASLEGGAENERISGLNSGGAQGSAPTTPPAYTDEGTHAPYSDSRKNFIIRQGLQLEKYLLSQLRSIDDRFDLARQNLSALIETRIEEMELKTEAYANDLASSNEALSQELHQQKIQIEDEINSLRQDMIPGVENTPPDQIFGINLSRDQDGYLELPPDLALIGSSATGVISSKIANLDIHLNNPVVWVRLHDITLAEAIRFLAGHAGLPVLISPEIEETDRQVNLDAEARILSILDAILHQHGVSVIYDSDLEVAQIISDNEFNNHIDRIRQAIENYNLNLFSSQRILELEYHRETINSILHLAGTANRLSLADKQKSGEILIRLEPFRHILPDLENQDKSAPLFHQFLARLSAHSFHASLREKHRQFDDLARLIQQTGIDTDWILPQLMSPDQAIRTELRTLDQLRKDRRRLVEMIAVSQHLLEGQAELFFEKVADLQRIPGGEILSDTLHHLSLLRLSLAENLHTYDTEIYPAATSLAQSDPVRKQSTRLRDQRFMDTVFPELETIAVHDPCIHPGREIYSEKISVYGGETSVTKIEAILEQYFTASTSPQQVNTSEVLHAETTETPTPAGLGDILQGVTPENPSAKGTETSGPAPGLSPPEVTSPQNDATRPAGCGGDPAASSPGYVRADDFSGFVVFGLISDVELVLKLIEEFDQPQRQVLIEVFMINITRDFGRRLNLSFQTDALAENLDDTGEFFLRRELTELSHTVTSRNAGGFVSGLISPNHRVHVLAP